MKKLWIIVALGLFIGPSYSQTLSDDNKQSVYAENLSDTFKKEMVEVPKTLQSGTIQLLNEGASYGVKISVNGSDSIACSFDSGATVVFLSQDIVNWLGSKGNLKFDDGIGRSRATIASGQSVETLVFNIRHLEIGDNEHGKIGLSDVKAMTLFDKSKKKKETVCLVGTSVLKAFKSWKVDNETDQITFEWYQ